MKLGYYNNCIGWDRRDIRGLTEMTDNNREITRKTFLKNVDKDELTEIESEIGYAKHPSKGLTMAGDGYVTYHKSKLHEKDVYYFRWSAIEYVFAGHR